MSRIKKGRIPGMQEFDSLRLVIRTQKKEIELLTRVIEVISEHPPKWESIGYAKYVAACNNVNSFYYKLQKEGK